MSYPRPWIPEAAAFQKQCAEFLNNGGDISQLNPVQIHNVYLLTSCLYYKHAVSIIRDEVFDYICKYMLHYYETFKQHVMWADKYLDPDLLRAGTGFSLAFDDTTLLIAEHCANS